MEKGEPCPIPCPRSPPSTGAVGGAVGRVSGAREERRPPVGPAAGGEHLRGVGSAGPRAVAWEHTRPARPPAPLWVGSAPEQNDRNRMVSPRPVVQGSWFKPNRLPHNVPTNTSGRGGQARGTVSHGEGPGVPRWVSAPCTGAAAGVGHAACPVSGPRRCPPAKLPAVFVVARISGVKGGTTRQLPG